MLAGVTLNSIFLVWPSMIQIKQQAVLSCQQNVEQVRYSIFLIKVMMVEDRTNAGLCPRRVKTENFPRKPCKKKHTSFGSNMKPKHFLKSAHVNATSSHLQLPPEKEQGRQGIQKLAETCKIHFNLIWTGAVHLHSSGKNFSIVCSY